MDILNPKYAIGGVCGAALALVALGMLANTHLRTTFNKKACDEQIFGKIRITPAIQK